MTSTRAIIIDGYVDEPGCLGVPPYLATYPRYVHGVLASSKVFDGIDYLTIDDLRAAARDDNLTTRGSTYDWAVFVSGVSVPGKYLGKRPVSAGELRRFPSFFPRAVTVLCGPAARFGIGQEGGKPSVPASTLQPWFDIIITGDAEVVLDRLLNDPRGAPLKGFLPAIPGDVLAATRPSMDVIDPWAIAGASVVLQHPNFHDGPGKHEGGNLVCEIETFRGCPRHVSGGCSFCVEPTKGPTMHRTIESIVAEVGALHDLGVRHVRLGCQADFFAFQHGDFEGNRYPRPDPRAITRLLDSIRQRCPTLETLHVDNVNPLNFVLYPDEAREITRTIATRCTPGNVAAIGVESVDPVVLARNNLKATAEEIVAAVRIINEEGATRGENGSPAFLPGLNFILGLPGETPASLEMNMALLRQLVDEGLLLRRINIRKLLPSQFLVKEPGTLKTMARSMRALERVHASWKAQVREEIDRPLLRRAFPAGTILSGAWTELHEGKGTYCRQPGTYPILCYVPRILDLHVPVDLRVVDHGFRSLTCLVEPVDLAALSLNELEHLPCIGKKRATRLFVKRPMTRAAWLAVVSEGELATIERATGNRIE